MILRVNPAGAAIVGRTVDEVTGTFWPELLHPDDVALATAEQGSSQDAGQTGPIYVRAVRPDGSSVWIRANGTQLPDPVMRTFVVFEDVTHEREVSERLVDAESSSARQIAQQSAVAQLGREALGGATIGELSASASALVVDTLGVSLAGVLLDDGTDPSTLALVGGAGALKGWVGRYRHPRDERVEGTLSNREPTVVTDIALDPGTGGRRALVEAGIRAVAATPIVPRNADPGMLITGAAWAGDFSIEDITFLETIANVVATALDAHQAVDDLRFNALHDDLTGLPNRALLLDRLELALEQTTSHGLQVAVLVCDLDRFKVVNDGMGHAAGDVVLTVVADRLRTIVRGGDTVGRFGGDEFVIVCPEIADVSEVVDIAERLAAGFREPVKVMGSDLVATASIGIALGTGTGPEPAAGLLRDADAAMYRAKAHGRARYELFDEDMRAWASERLRTETELRRAIAGDELVLHYQPVLSVVDGAVLGVEALVRWVHPDRGLLPPDEFLGVAEDSGILPELGTWVFREAARQTAAWVGSGLWLDRWTAVNLAPSELTDAGLVDRIAATIDELGLDARHLRVELTEEALIEDTAQAGAILESLRDRGLRISIDDFGTGYSSLAYLKRFPVDSLKLDRTFVNGLGEEEDDLAIASAVISMARALGLRVVAEGVETEVQLAVLRSIGCDQAQGFLFARPMPAGELAGWLESR